MPFEFMNPAETKLTLRVEGPKDFKVVHGFRYKDQYDHDKVYTVTDETETDLASVPFFLQWLVLSYGKHTSAAIVHDVYWGPKEQNQTRAELRQANTAFRHAMWESDVPFLRRWFMWTAVTLAMLGKSQDWPRVAIWAAGLVTVVAAVLAANGVVVAWPVVAVVGVAAVVLVVATAIVRKLGSKIIAGIGQKAQLFVGLAAVVLVLLAAVGHVGWVAEHPVLASVAALGVGIVAWGRLWIGAVLATVEVAVILLPVLAIAVGLFLYLVLEVAMYGLLKAIRALKRKPVGTLNWLFTDRLETPTPPKDVSLEARQD